MHSQSCSHLGCRCLQGVHQAFPWLDVPLLVTAACVGITESQHCRGWNGSLEIIRSSSPAKAGSVQQEGQGRSGMAKGITGLPKDADNISLKILLCAQMGSSTAATAVSWAESRALIL